ncbi:hypothetical protein LC613_41830 [Nostoc sphaeroides CHAB 2801]|uniref:hypothetical protein n=1 Tax=Nostoc sphaeroides TaxID=446679 RepID=UPI001E308121|nr:hypothetical protein [Nostoc sphaeroides]MCC5633952.1 hypothetical protein [Nostoc sphaeroides CHAB 2801]
MYYSDLNHHQPITEHGFAPRSEVNPNLPLAQIPIPVRLTISNTDSIANLGDKLSVELTSAVQTLLQFQL